MDPERAGADAASPAGASADAASRIRPDEVPALVGQASARWGVELIGEGPAYGDWNLVFEARRRSPEGPETLCVVKICGPGHDGLAEIAALRAWDGRGAVRLLEADPVAGMLLLERLDAHRTLRALDWPAAAEVLGTLARELAIPVPLGTLGPGALPRLTDRAAELAATLPDRARALGSPVPRRWVDRAYRLARELATDDADLLVHGDLHDGNILAAGRAPWLAIDPKPVVGQAERAICEFLWNRVDDTLTDADIRSMVRTIVRAGSLEASRAYAWIDVRVVDYWLWALSVGLTIDPARCERLLDALDERRG